MKTVASRSLPKRDLVVGMILFLPAFFLIVLQGDATNQGSWQRAYFDGFFRGTTPGNTPQEDMIFNARLMTRWLVPTLARLGPPELKLDHVNFVVQVAFLWPALFLIYNAARLLVVDTLAFSAPFIASVYLLWGYLGPQATVPYDMPAFFFAAAGTWAVVTFNFPVVALCATVGTLNKETTLWLIPAYFFVCARKDGFFSKKLLVRVGLLCIGYVATYGLTKYAAFAEVAKQGESILDALPASSLKQDSNIWSKPLMNFQCLTLRFPGDRFRRLTQNVYWVLSLHTLAILFWRRLPGDLRAFYLVTPFLIGPLLFFGQIWEFRLFNELIPLGVVALLVVLERTLFAIPDRPEAVRVG